MANNKKKSNFYLGAILFAIVVSATSCNEKKFQKTAWAARTDANFPPAERAEVLDDLLSSYKLVGMKYAGVVDLLGTPNGANDSSMVYEIEVDYGTDIDPVYMKDLYLFVTRDSIVSSYEIREWRSGDL